MEIDFGDGTSDFGPGVEVNLTGDEVAGAIHAYLVAHGVYVSGPCTVIVNNDLCRVGKVYVDPSGFVITPGGTKMTGRGEFDPDD